MPDVIMRNPVLSYAPISRFWILGKFRVSYLEIIPNSSGRCVVLRDILRKLWYRIHREFQFLFKGVMLHGKMRKRKWHSELKRKCGTVRLAELIEMTYRCRTWDYLLRQGIACTCIRNIRGCVDSIWIFSK